MQNRLLSSLLVAAAFGAVLVAVLPALAQEPPPAAGQAPAAAPGGRGGRGGRGGFGRGMNLPPPGPTPHTADGHPDMSGYWNAGNNGGAVFEVQKHPARSQSLPAGNGAIVDPPDGLIPYQPWAAEKAKDNFEHHLADEPELHCYESGLPNQMYRQFGFQILEPGGYVVMNWEFMHAVRIIPTDNRPHVLPPSKKLFQGDSVGHWEGDTLVVDTIGFNGQTWLDTEPERLTSDALHVVERFSRPDFEHINYEVTVSDPKMYTKPWTNTRVFVLMKPGQELLEYSCEENNKEISEGHVSDALTQKK